MTDTARIPDKPALEGLESVWGAAWEREGTYRFDRDSRHPRADLTRSTLPRPRPRVRCTSATSSRYTHTDVVARYQRMRGKSVFYPMGWDDNGLPTERRVQNYYGVRCDPTLPYDRRLRAALRGRRRQVDEGGRPGADQPPQLHRAVRAAHRRRREAVRGALAHARPLGRLDPDLPHDRRRVDLHLAARVPAQRRARRGLPGARADPVGRHLPHRGRAGRARRPRAAGPLPPRRLPPARRRRHRDRDHPSRAPPRVRRPRRAPRRRALPAAVRHDRHARPSSASRCRWSPTTSPRRTRARASR